ncbi:MAG: hypothetical protein AAGD32_07310 [Planctomycetota bacterium]
MRSSLVAAGPVVLTAAVLSVAVVGCKPKAEPPVSTEMPTEMRASAIDRATQLQAVYGRDVSGAKVGAITEVKTIDGGVFIAAEITGIPNGALALIIDGNEQQVGLVKAFNGAGGQTFFEVLDSNRPIAPGDFVVRFPEGTAVELRPVDGPST